MTTDSKAKPINLMFNVSVCFYFMLAGVGLYLFTPEDDPTTKVPWDAIADMNMAVGMIGAIVLIFAVLGLGTYLVMQFWNRFVSDVFKVRTIVFQEALGITLFSGLFMQG